MNGSTKATLILADDHPLFVKGLIAVLQKEFLIVAVARDGIELLDLLKLQQSDGILLDLQMPHLDGLSAAKQIATRYPQIKLIILSGFYENEIEDELKHVGVKGYLSKDIESSFLIYQINQVLAGKTIFYAPNKDGYFTLDRAPKINLTEQFKLSPREFEVISLIKKGLTSLEIGKNLFISVNTVEVHRKHIFKKLNLRNVQGLVEFAHKYSL
jgi:DNA-binding NarL/FixJ family response regulator